MTMFFVILDIIFFAPDFVDFNKVLVVISKYFFNDFASASPPSSDCTSGYDVQKNGDLHRVVLPVQGDIAGHGCR